VDKHVHRKKETNARQADASGARSSKPAVSQAQRRRDRQQTGVAKSHAADAEKLSPALHAGVFSPEKLVSQVLHVLKEAKLCTERHHEGQISEGTADHIITAIKHFAQALLRLGIKVPGLLKVKQSHYLSVMALWDREPPADASRVECIVSPLRRLFVVIGRPDVIPRGARNKLLLSQRGIIRGGDAAFLLNTHFDWANADIDVETVFQPIADPGRRVAARMIHFWGMSLPEVAAWQAVDPARCSFLHVEAINGRRSIREAEFSRDPKFAAKQMSAIKEAWNYCRQQDRLTIRPSDLAPEQYAERLGQSICRALTKQLPDQKFKRLTPMQLRDGFFCQVFRDYAGMSLQEARRSPRLAQQDRHFAQAWNEAKRQTGVQGARAAGANKGTPYSWSQSVSIARSLRPITSEFANLRVGDAWVGDVDASAGKCLFVQLLEGARAGALLRLEELIEQTVVVKLRVVRVLGAGDVPEGAALVMVRSVPV
jgi:hypothetical protein